MIDKKKRVEMQRSHDVLSDKIIDKYILLFLVFPPIMSL